MKIITYFFSLIFTLLFFLFALIGLGVFYWSSLTSTTPLYWLNLTATHWQKTPPSLLNILLLGQDPRSDQLENSLATDTIIIGQYRPGSFKAISFPRDLWDEASGSRINRFYWNKIESKLSPPALWSSLSADFHRVSGVSPDKHLLVTTADLVNLTSLIGGVDINLDYSFTDDLYPNPEYIKNPTPDTPIYISVTYQKGINHLTAKNILPFVRSRKSSEDPTLGGTDLGRIARQQLVISAFTKKITQLSPLEKTKLAAKIYHYFRTNMTSSLTDSDLFLLAKSYLQTSSLSFKFCTLPVYPDQPNGLVYHPDYFPSNAWVYLPRATTYEEIHQFTASCLAP